MKVCQTNQTDTGPEKAPPADHAAAAVRPPRGQRQTFARCLRSLGSALLVLSLAVGVTAPAFAQGGIVLGTDKGPGLSSAANSPVTFDPANLNPTLGQPGVSPKPHLPWLTRGGHPKPPPGVQIISQQGLPGGAGQQSRSLSGPGASSFGGSSLFGGGGVLDGGGGLGGFSAQSFSGAIRPQSVPRATQGTGKLPFGDLTIASSFNAVGAVLFEPPDPCVAAGPNHVIEMTNNGLGVYTKAGKQVRAATLESWFSNVEVDKNLPGGAFLSDPHVVYDQYAQRWVMMALNGFPFGPGLQKSSYLISVSDTSDPTGTWHNYSTDMQFDASTFTGNWTDYPGLGFDKQAVYLTGNIYDFTLGSVYAKIRILKKSELYANGASRALTYYDFYKDSLIDPVGNSNFFFFSDPHAFTIIPARSYGETDTEYLLDTPAPGTLLPYNIPNFFYFASTSMTLWSIKNPTSGAPILDSKNVPTVPYVRPFLASQPGSYINANDARLLDTVISRDGEVWTAHNVSQTDANGFPLFIVGDAAIHWVHIDAEGGKTLEDGIYQGPGNTSYVFPGISVDSLHNLYMAFTRTSPTEYPSAVATARLAGLGPFNSFPAPQLIKAGTSTYFYSRWGDYSGAALDPVNESMWVGAEYSTDKNLFGTFIANLKLKLAPVAPNLLSVTGLGDAFGTAIANGQAVGYGSGSMTGNGVHALQWPSITSNSSDLSPGLPGPLRALAISGNTKVGDGVIGGYNHAALFPAVGPVVDLNPRGFLNSSAVASTTGQQVGYGYRSGGDYRALLWNGSATNYSDLTPAGFTRSYAFAIGGGIQAGGAVAVNGVVHPSVWTGTASSYRDLLPAGFLGGYATGISGSDIVGFGWPNGSATGGLPGTTTGVQHALYWTGSPPKATDIHPFTRPVLDGGSEALSMANGLIVGYAYGQATAGKTHAFVWFTGLGGSAVPGFDLHSLLGRGPGGQRYVASWASGIDDAGEIIGTGLLANGKHVAIVWK